MQLPVVRERYDRSVKRPSVGKADIVLKRRKRHPNRALTEAQIRLLLQAIENIREDALIRLGLSTGLRVSEVVSIRTSELDFERGLIKIWDEKKDRWRYVMPTLDTMSTLRKYINSASLKGPWLFPSPHAPMQPLSTKSVERIIQKYSKQALGFLISWHSLRTTYVSRSVELEQSPAVVMANTGDSPATILKYYTKLPEVVMRRFVESKPVIPQERI